MGDMLDLGTLAVAARRSSQRKAVWGAIGFVAVLDRQPLRPPEILALRAHGYETTAGRRGEMIVRAVS